MLSDSHEKWLARIQASHAWTNGALSLLVNTCVNIFKLVASPIDGMCKNLILQAVAWNINHARKFLLIRLFLGQRVDFQNAERQTNRMKKVKFIRREIFLATRFNVNMSTRPEHCPYKAPYTADMTPISPNLNCDNNGTSKFYPKKTAFRDKKIWSSFLWTISSDCSICHNFN